MKIIVTGGRNYTDFNKMKTVLDKFENIEKIITGGASGADNLAKIYAKENNITYEEYVAKWDEYGKAAGPIRNYQMCSSNTDATVIVFPGGNGTKHCEKIANKFGMDVEVIDADS